LRVGSRKTFIHGIYERNEQVDLTEGAVDKPIVQEKNQATNGRVCLLPLLVKLDVEWRVKLEMLRVLGGH